MNWLRKHYIACTLTVILILISIDVSIRIWFWQGWYLSFDSTVFNNIVTPISSIASLVILVATVFFVVQQNKVLVSGNLKQNFDKQYDHLKDRLSEPIVDELNKVFWTDTPDQYDIAQLNSLNFVKTLDKVLNRLWENREFRDDYGLQIKSRKSKGIDVDIVATRSYHDDLHFLLCFSYYPLVQLELVTTFLDEINTSEMIKEDKKYYRNKVQHELLSKYFSFLSKGSFAVPDFIGFNRYAIWCEYTSTGVNRYYNPLMRRITLHSTILDEYLLERR